MRFDSGLSNACVSEAEAIAKHHGGGVVSFLTDRQHHAFATWRSDGRQYAQDGQRGPYEVDASDIPSKIAQQFVDATRVRGQSVKSAKWLHKIGALT